MNTYSVEQYEKINSISHKQTRFTPGAPAATASASAPTTSADHKANVTEDAPVHFSEVLFDTYFDQPETHFDQPTLACYPGVPIY
jgi:hypothetical protein